MAKEEKGKREEGSHPKHQGKKMHLHEIRSTQAEDGSIVHHHTYKQSKEHPHTMPERGPMATSSTPEEAGQHVEDQFAMNQGGGGAAEPDGDEGQGTAPDPGAGGAAAMG